MLYNRTESILFVKPLGLTPSYFAFSLKHLSYLFQQTARPTFFDIQLKLVGRNNAVIN